jgi:dolichyl-phosphate beta-glucosyltransferase
MLSIVIPAFNEEKRLAGSLEKLKNFVEDYPQEVESIIVDDGSTDNTVRLAETYIPKIKGLRILKLAKNSGKGSAVKFGFEKAVGDIVLFTDADFSTPITEATKLVEKINSGFDVAIGSRELDPSLVVRSQSFLRHKFGRTANFLIQLLAVPGIKDTQCGFKAFKKSTTKEVFAEEKIFGYAFDIELLFLAKRMGLKIAEVAVLWSHSTDSKINPLIDAPKCLIDLARIRLVHARNNQGFIETFLFQIHHRRGFAKFAIVGLTGAIVDYSGFFVFTRFLHLPPLQANPLSVEIAIIWTFIFNNLWTFRHRNKDRALYKKFLVFQTVAFGGLVVSQIQILLYTHFWGIFDLIAKFISLPLVATFNYTTNSRWTFHPEKISLRRSLYYFFLILTLVIVYLVLVRQFTGSFNLFIER